MIFSQTKTKNFLYFLFLLFFLNACQKVDPTTGEKILIEPDPNKKAREFADRGGGIFGDINKIGKLSWWATKQGVIAFVAAQPAVVQTTDGLLVVLLYPIAL